MAVAFDAKMTAGNQTTLQVALNGTSISSTGMTVGATATLLVVVLVFCSSGGSPPGTVTATWAGGAMTPGPVQTQSNPTAVIFYKVNPTTGNQTLAASWQNQTDCYMSCVSFTGTNTSTGINTNDNAATTQATALTVTSDVNGATVAVFSGNGNCSGTDKTTIFTYDVNNPGGGASYAIGGTPSNVHNFTSTTGTNRALVGVHVVAPDVSTTPITVNNLPTDNLAGGEIV